MIQTEMNLNPPKLSPQCQKLYDRLMVGSLRTDQMRDELRLISHTKRISELKRILEPEMTIEKNYIGNGLFEYKIKQIFTCADYETEMDRASKYIDKYKGY